MRTSLGCRALRFGAPESHQRVDAKRPELASFDQLCTAVRQRPISQALARISKLMLNDSFRQSLNAATEAREMYDIIVRQESML